jgi:hypothetical protein
MTWLTTNPPNDGNPFLADIGYPWPVFAAWNGCDCCYVYANLQCNMVDGVYNDTYFENEYEKPNGVKRWMPLPELPPT